MQHTACWRGTSPPKWRPPSDLGKGHPTATTPLGLGARPWKWGKKEMFSCLAVVVVWWFLYWRCEGGEDAQEDLKDAVGMAGDIRGHRAALGLLLDVVRGWEGGVTGRHWVVTMQGSGKHRAVLCTALRRALPAMLERGAGWRWCGALEAPGGSGAGSGRCSSHLWPRPSVLLHIRRKGEAASGRLLLVASPANQRRRAGNSKLGGACAGRHEWRGAARGGGAAVRGAAGRARGVRGHRGGMGSGRGSKVARGRVGRCSSPGFAAAAWALQPGLSLCRVAEARVMLR